MGYKTLTMPEDALVNMLKTLREDSLLDVFWRTVVESDISPLTKEEKKRISKGKLEHKKGETIKWQDLR
ncbi:MAG: hypothetical protein Q7U68_06305 [Candidatus Roizmanbacteria bacterium]|nr:hypothetical protein [Candidatus Roizmanbacteria bacterium]